MSSIIEGYNYDIFISYRQKDNRHDGWVTEFVDKLKCLIFIPIISRTYCDPKSFTWEHEFKEFVNMASPSDKIFGEK
jgi:hypothetical protein